MFLIKYNFIQNKRLWFSITLSKISVFFCEVVLNQRHLYWDEWIIVFCCGVNMSDLRHNENKSSSCAGGHFRRLGVRVIDQASTNTSATKEQYYYTIDDSAWAVKGSKPPIQHSNKLSVYISDWYDTGVIKRNDIGMTYSEFLSWMECNRLDVKHSRDIGHAYASAERLLLLLLLQEKLRKAWEMNLEEPRSSYVEAELDAGTCQTRQVWYLNMNETHVSYIPWVVSMLIHW